jgi:hypothetical protein
MAAMTRLAVAGIMVTVFWLSAEAQTIRMTVLDQAGAQTVLQAGQAVQLLTIVALYIELCGILCCTCP